MTHNRQALDDRLKQLCENEHIVDVIKDDHLFVTPTIDYARYGNDAENAKTAVQQILQVLRAPYIVDDFSDHEDRRAWQKTLEADCPGMLQACEYNALAAGQWSGAFCPLHILAVYEGRTATPQLAYKDAVRSFMRQVEMFQPKMQDDSTYKTPYDRMNIEEKIRFIRSLKQAAYDTLCKLVSRE